MILLYILGLISLSIYSYSQVDLNLTLSANHYYLWFQSLLTNLGYYQRYLSAGVYFVIISLLFVAYQLIIARTVNGISRKKIIILVSSICIIGLIAYVAFSYDFFNYLFDARIITKYGQNPYFFKPQDFGSDTWLRFMHWVHRTYPYGPLWLLMSVVPSFLGFEKFVLTVLNFKVLFLVAYLSNAYLIYKIANKVKTNMGLVASLTYLLNPLVIIESVFSPHLDSWMATFMLLGFWFYLQGKKKAFFASILMSAGVKFITGILLLIPVFRKKSFEYIVRLSISLLFVTLIPVVIQRELYPWYVLPMVALASLVPQDKFLSRFTFFLTLGLSLSYVPFLAVGEYPFEVQVVKNIFIFLPVTIFVIVSCLNKNYR